MALTQAQIDAINSILVTLKGEPGLPGKDGVDGTDGVDGKRAVGNVYSLSDDFGADNTGVNPCDTQLAKAISSGVKRLYIPGIYRVNNPMIFDVAGRLEIFGDGMEDSGFESYTTTDDMVKLVGPTGKTLYDLHDFAITYKGKGQPAGKHGLRAMRRVYANNILVLGSTNDGIFTDSIDGTANGQAFFCRWDNVWSQKNGRDGFALRFGANAHVIDNCKFDRNARDGFHHYTDGAATYNTTIGAGQGSYNGRYGWNFESGTSIHAVNLYAEGNQRANNVGYANGSIDYFIADNCSHSSIALGAVMNNLLEHVRAPKQGINHDTVAVTYGGVRLYGWPAVAA